MGIGTLAGFSVNSATLLEKHRIDYHLSQGGKAATIGKVVDCENFGSLHDPRNQDLPAGPSHHSHAACQGTTRSTLLDRFWNGVPLCKNTEKTRVHSNHQPLQL